MTIEVTRGVIARLFREAAKAAPEECCGILLGAQGHTGVRIDEALPAANVHPDRLTRFEIDPAALIAAHRAARAGGREVLGYFHSHPEGHPVPSATDCIHASGDNRAWAIVAAGEMRLWRDGDSGFEALSYTVVDG